ncbi:hypothetical protein ACIQBJ_06780 [Kitasatospora sp. NPDC088391]|uniref:hypothetical protein n=1 Tax=Kitasatospora sp. NPDC088391 TaxID=3364074 RepID=UPI0037F539DF
MALAPKRRGAAADTKDTPTLCNVIGRNSRPASAADATATGPAGAARPARWPVRPGLRNLVETVGGVLAHLRNARLDLLCAVPPGSRDAETLGLLASWNSSRPMTGTSTGRG